MRTKPTKIEHGAEYVGAWIYGLGGRRFIMAMGAHFVNTALFVFKILSENGYIILFGMTIGTYLGANTIESMKGNTINPKSPPR